MLKLPVVLGACYVLRRRQHSATDKSFGLAWRRKQLMGFGTSAGDLDSSVSERRVVLMGELLVVLHLRSFSVPFFFFQTLNAIGCSCLHVEILEFGQPGCLAHAGSIWDTCLSSIREKFLVLAPSKH